MDRFNEYVTNCIFELDDFYGSVSAISDLCKSLPGASVALEGALAGEDEFVSGENTLDDYLQWMSLLDVCEILYDAGLDVVGSVQDMYDRLNTEYPCDEDEYGFYPDVYVY